MLGNKNTVVHCLFMLVHSALANNSFDFNHVSVNAEINISNITIVTKISKCCISIVQSYSMLNKAFRPINSTFL